MNALLEKPCNANGHLMILHTSLLPQYTAKFDAVTREVLSLKRFGKFRAKGTNCCRHMAVNTTHPPTDRPKWILKYQQ